ncbi:MAG: helix-turn-helix domain-containing protein [Acidobacteriota bacterium]
MTVEAETRRRGDTKQRLLRAAEKLIAEHGITGTSTRAILKEAEQRNESALQYHFGGRKGLLEALYVERGGQVAAEREVLLGELIESGRTLDLRSVCEVAFLPPVRLARRDPNFVRFLRVVGQLAFLPDDELRQTHETYELGNAGKVFQRVVDQLELPEGLLERRLELLHRTAAIALSQRARSGGSFEGPEADLYFETVLDAMTGIVEGPISPATTAALAAVAAQQTSRNSR